MRRIVLMLALVSAGELVFGLAFYLPDNARLATAEEREINSSQIRS